MLSQLFGRRPPGLPSLHMYQSRLGFVRDDRDSMNQGCSLEARAVCVCVQWMQFDDELACMIENKVENDTHLAIVNSLDQFFDIFHSAEHVHDLLIVRYVVTVILVNSGSRTVIPYVGYLHRWDS